MFKYDLTHAAASTLWGQGDEPSIDYNPYPQDANSLSTVSSDIKEFLKMVESTRKNVDYIHSKGVLLQVFDDISCQTGKAVELKPEFRFVPVIVGKDNRIVPLFQFVEVLDEFADYDKIKEALPSLSFSQINGAISFLQKVSQINPDAIDFDEWSDIADCEDSEFIGELEKAFRDKGDKHVLYLDKTEIR